MQSRWAASHPHPQSYAAGLAGAVSRLCPLGWRDDMRTRLVTCARGQLWHESPRELRVRVEEQVTVEPADSEDRRFYPDVLEAVRNRRVWPLRELASLCSG